MKTKRVFFVFALLLLISCQNNAVKDAISAQLRQYPDTRVQDIYKNFCQDNLGPGHLVPDPEAAKSYLLTELELYRADLDSARYDKPASRYVPVGDKGNYVRVDLSVVLDGICDADRLLEAFVRSANEGKTVTEEQWKEKWKEISTIIRKDFYDIPDAEKDLDTIDSLVAEDHLIMHHSRAFSQAYHPHYRIVAKDIFEDFADHIRSKCQNPRTGRGKECLFREYPVTCLAGSIPVDSHFIFKDSQVILDTCKVYVTKVGELLPTNGGGSSHDANHLCT